MEIELKTVEAKTKELDEYLKRLEMELEEPKWGEEEKEEIFGWHIA